MSIPKRVNEKKFCPVEDRLNLINEIYQRNREESAKVKDFNEMAETTGKPEINPVSKKLANKKTSYGRVDDRLY